MQKKYTQKIKKKQKFHDGNNINEMDRKPYYKSY